MSTGSVNKVILVGNLGAAPTVHDLSGGNVIVKINIATTVFWKDKTTKENRSKTEWHRVVFYGRLADVAKKYLKKGMKVYIEGSLTTNVWEGQNGVKRSSTEISATQLQMLTSRIDLDVNHNEKNLLVTDVEDKYYDDLPF